MFTQEYTRAAGYFKITLLMEQIYTAYPALVETIDNIVTPHLILEGNEDGHNAIVTITKDGIVTEPDIAAIVDAHDSAQLSINERMLIVYEGAKPGFEVNAPDWAYLTHQQWAAYHAANVEPEIGAIAPHASLVLLRLGHVAISYRDLLWPDFAANEE